MTIRGVNLGGWLVLERYITPSLFALTTCSVSKSPTSPCLPLLPYPVDQWTLASSFPDAETYEDYMSDHWSTFVTEDDIMSIASSNLTHVRVPVGHWIMGDVSSSEPYAPSTSEWSHFVRVARLCREHGLEVWIDLHTAPGSQNGFDNSGRTLPVPTGLGWSGVPSNVDRTVRAVADIARGIKEAGLSDVVTGFGVLNEPFKGENAGVVKDFDDRAFEAGEPKGRGRDHGGREGR